MAIDWKCFDPGFDPMQNVFFEQKWSMLSYIPVIDFHREAVLALWHEACASLDRLHGMKNTPRADAFVWAENERLRRWAKSKRIGSSPRLRLIEGIRRYASVEWPEEKEIVMASMKELLKQEVNERIDKLQAKVDGLKLELVEARSELLAKVKEAELPRLSNFCPKCGSGPNRLTVQARYSNEEQVYCQNCYAKFTVRP